MTHSNNKGENESYCSSPKIIKFITQKFNHKTSEKKHKTNVILHPHYQSTNSPEEFMKYNFNFEKEIHYIQNKEENQKFDNLEEDNIHINPNQLNENFSLINSKTELPKLIWSKKFFTNKELKIYLRSIEKKWPIKLADFNEEIVLKILTLCNNKKDKCKDYIMSNEFKKLLMKQKKEKGSRKSDMYS